MQLFIVSNESNTYYFANNNKEHFAFDADERFLPVYQFADKENKKITHLHDFSSSLPKPKTVLGRRERHRQGQRKAFVSSRPA